MKTPYEQLTEWLTAQPGPLKPLTKDEEREHEKWLLDLLEKARRWKSHGGD